MRAIRSAARRCAVGFLGLATAIPAAVIVTVTAAGPAAAATTGFADGNLVVLRVGDGSAMLTSAAAPSFLDEFTPAGVLVQSIALPTTASGANRPLTNAGSSTSEGFLSRSTDGAYLVLGGYDAAPGTASVAGTSAATTNRVIGRVDGNGVVDTSTALTDAYSGGNIRSVTSDDGSRFWTGGSNTGGVRHATLGATTSTQLLATSINARVVGIADGQLFVTTQTTLNAVDTGLPTTGGQTVTPLPGTSFTAAYGFIFLDRSATVPGVDTLYVAQDAAAPGLSKFSFDGTAWTARGSLGTTTRGLTGSVTGSDATLFATTTATTANSVIRVVDTAAFDAPISATSTTVATGIANTALRGVAFAPAGDGTPSGPVITDQPDDTIIVEGQTATLTVTATGTDPLSYQWYQGNSGDTTTPIDDATDAGFTTPALTVTTSYWVRVTDPIGSVDSATATITVTSLTPCTVPATPIGEVQGSGETSPLAGQTVTVRGTVVADFEGASPALRGFYLQDGGDGDAATSDGIFVFNNNDDDVANGDVVEVTGVAGENFGQTQVSPSATGVTLCGVSGTVPPTDVTLPLPDATALEPVEGMLTRFPQDLTVTELFQLGRFGQVTVSSGGRLNQPTNVLDADDQAAVQALQAANNLNRLIIDDASQAQNPDPIVFGRGGQPLTASNTLRGGDTVTAPVGVMTYTWGGNSASPNAYRLRPVGALDGSTLFSAQNPRPTVAPEVGDGDLRVASVNLLNFFNTFTGCTFGVGGATADCRGADSDAEYQRQLAKEVTAIQFLDADVVSYMEMENDGYGPTSAVQALVDALNAEAGAGTWAFVDPDTVTGILNSAGDDAIKAGHIYRTASVTPVAGATYTNLDDVFDRAPVSQTFATADGERVSVIANHFKSKGSCPSSGPDADQGDGQSCWNARRTAQATELASWITSTVVPGAGDPDVMILGDLNSYAGEDPVGVLEDAGYTNLVRNFQGADAYSYVFDGQWGYLDYQLASPSLLAQVAGANDAHINSDEPSILDYNLEFKSAAQQDSLYAPDQYRTSDHDPVLSSVNLSSQVASTVTVTSSANPSGLNAPLTFTAQVAPATEGVVPTGTVQFLVDGRPAGVPVALDPEGTATLTSPRINAGGHLVTATYSGDERVSGSTSPEFVQVVQYVVAFLSPTAGQQIAGGSVLTVRFRLTDVRGVPIADTTAQRLIAVGCRVRVSVTGAQTLAPTCPAYDPQTNAFSLQRRAAAGPTGEATANVTLAYPGVPQQVESRPFTIV